MNYIQYCQTPAAPLTASDIKGGLRLVRDAVRKGAKKIGLTDAVNSAGKSWKEFWDKPMTVQYAYSPYEVVGNEGKPNETTLRRGDIAKEAATAIGAPVIIVGSVTAGAPATIGGLVLGAGGAYAGNKAGQGVGYMLGTDENGTELLSDGLEFVGSLYGGAKGAKYGKAYSNLGKGYEEAVAEAITEVEQPVKTSQAVTGRDFWIERPGAKISDAERQGLPKGIERDLSDPEILKNAKIFAEKYGYDIPENIELAKLMYKLHNTFIRTVSIPEKGWRDIWYPDWFMNLSRDEKIKILSTRGYSKAQRFGNPEYKDLFLDESVFVTPDKSRYHYDDVPDMGTGIVRRPFSFRNPKTWHIDADFEFSPDSELELWVPGKVFQGNDLTTEVKLGTPYLISEGVYYPEVKLSKKLDAGIDPVKQPLGWSTYDWLVYLAKKGLLKQGGPLNYLSYLR